MRYTSLAQTRPEDSTRLLDAAQAAILEKYRTYEEMAGWSASRFAPAGVGTLCRCQMSWSPNSPGATPKAFGDERARERSELPRAEPPHAFVASALIDPSFMPGFAATASALLQSGDQAGSRFNLDRFDVEGRACALHIAITSGRRQ